DCSKREDSTDTNWMVNTRAYQEAEQQFIGSRFIGRALFWKGRAVVDNTASRAFIKVCDIVVVIGARGRNTSIDVDFRYRAVALGRTDGSFSRGFSAVPRNALRQTDGR